MTKLSSFAAIITAFGLSGMPDLLFTPPAVQRFDHAGYDGPSISSTNYPPTPRAVSTISESHSLRIGLSASCMDLRQHGQDPTSRRLRNQDSRASLQFPSTAATAGHQAYSSPLPQSQWSNVPLPYRPADMVDPTDQRLPLPLAQQEWRQRQGISGNALSTGAVPAPPRDKRRPRDLRDVPIRSTRTDDEEVVDYSSLYPPMSPYDGRLSSYSAPDEMQHVRSVSQPSSASYLQTTFDPEMAPPSLHIPRSPTYPPAGSRGGRPRMHSHSGVTEAAFDDEVDFRLFVEATAGLGPDIAFRQAQSNASSSSSQQRSSNSERSNHREALASPSERTLSPSTARALQQLSAHMPAPSPSFRAAPSPRQRLQTSNSGLDLWLQPPSTSASGEVSPLEEDMPPPDDELPDYASSQAQAQAGQRAEAARRAQELQRRWQQSGHQRGF